MSYYATLYVRPDTDINVAQCTYMFESRAVVAVETGALTIQANCWQDMQRLVAVLHDSIARARQIEQDAAVATDLA